MGNTNISGVGYKFKVFRKDNRLFNLSFYIALTNFHIC